MKTYFASEYTKAILLTFMTVFLLISTMVAQTIPLQKSFSTIIADGLITVTLNKSQTSSIEIINGENFSAEDVLNYSIKNDELTLTSTGKIKNLQVIVNYIDLTKIIASGASTVKSKDVIKTPTLEITSDGASDVDIIVNTEQLLLITSAASTVKLYGTATNVTAKASGAADIKAINLTAENATLDASGAADIKMNVTKSAVVTGAGAADVRLNEEPESISSDMTGVSTLKYGNISIENGLSEIVNDSIWSNNPIKRSRKKFNGHWGGVELGINTFVDNQFNTTLPSEYEFLNLKNAKSFTVQLNLIEKNIPIVKNQFGIVSGLGLWINNYRLSNNIVIGTDSLGLFGYADSTRNYVKSKLTASYLALPLIFEYQFRNKNGKEIFHIAAGGYGAVKLGSKTKLVYLNKNNKIKNKEHDDFDMNLFKYGLTARIGWKRLNFFGNYNLSALWSKNKGPVVYPFEVGITLLGW